MKLIVGLGNPGEKYKNNRHNAGFLFIDYLIKNLRSQNSNVKTQNFNFKLKIDKYSNSEIAQLDYDRGEIVLVKPQTFMNLSGVAVKKIIGYWKLEIGNLVVIHDDLDIPLGKFRVDLGRGPKMHNGIASIEQHLKTKDFLRVRIGVDNRQQTGPMDGESYVLQNFRPEEKKIVTELFPKIWDALANQF